MTQATRAIEQHGGKPLLARGGPGALAVATYAVAAGVVLYGTYGDPHPKANQESAVPVVLVAAAVVTAVVFAVLVPKGLRALREERVHAARWAVAHGVVALVLFPMAFWSGVPLIVGAGGVWLGLQTREQRAASGSPTRPGTAAVAMGAIAIVCTIAVTLIGNLAN
jgi:hypothetical protein